MMFRLFEIKGGKLTTFPDITSKKIRGFIISSIIILIIVSLSGWLKIDEKELWKLYNVILQQFGLVDNVPKIESEKEKNARIELEVDKAIRDVTPEYDRIISDYDQKYKPKYIELDRDESVCYSDECKKLGGEMRICAPWVDTCKTE